MKYKLIFLFLFLLFPMISAEGLTIVGDSNFIVNKTAGGDEQINFQLINEEFFPFYNITIDSSHISMSKIDILSPGESVNVTAIITTNDYFNGEIRVIGSYLSELGSGSEIHYIEADYYSGVNPCLKSIIQGDSVVWSNVDSNKDFKMINADTNTEIVALNVEESYNQTFNDVSVLNYYFTWVGFNINSGICQLNVLSSVGFITNPEHDALFNLTVNMEYPPTLLETTFLETVYILDPFKTTDGVLNIKNVGDKIAKNIYLDAKWFSFYDASGNPLNNFDLNVGYSKTILYTISPLVYETNETDKDYEILLSITGNFQTIIQNFSIYINYAEISGGGGEYKDFMEFFTDLYKIYCEENPYEDICVSSSGIIVGNVSQGDLSQQQMKEIMETIFGFIITYEENEKINKLQDEDQLGITDSLNNSMNEMKDDIKRIADEKESDKVFLISVVVALLFIGCLVLFFFINKDLDFMTSLKTIAARWSGRKYFKK